jgi:hypothetical protein
METLMNTSPMKPWLAVGSCIVAFQAFSLWAVTFTNNATLDYDDVSCDGADVVVEQGTPTVDSCTLLRVCRPWMEVS